MTAIPQHPDFAKYVNNPAYIVLLPVDGTLEISPFLKVHARELRFSEGLWFYAGSGYCLQKPGLMQLCAAANIGIQASWRTDDGRNPDFASHSVTGIIRQPDGTLRMLPGSKSIHVDEMVDRDYNAALKKREEKYKGRTDAQIREIAEANRASYRQFRGERAETGAIERMVRNALGMKTAYTKDETQKIFVVPVVAPNMDVLMMDPEVRRIAAVQALAATSTLFGPQARMLALPENTSPGMATPAALPDGSTATPALPPAAAAPAGPTPEEIMYDEWLNATPRERRTKLDALWNDRQHGKADSVLEDLIAGPADRQAKAIVWLFGLPTKSGGAATPPADPPPVDAPPQGNIGWTPSEKQIKRLYGIAKKHGYETQDAVHEFVAQHCGGIAHLSELTREQYDQLTGHEANPEYNQELLVGLFEQHPAQGMAIGATPVDPLDDLPF